MRESLRHFLSTIYYRGMKYLVDYNDDFNNFSQKNYLRSPKQILNHINGLLLYSKSFFIQTENTYPELLDLNLEIERFKKTIIELDDILDSSLEINRIKYEQLLQGQAGNLLGR